ncbi:AMP-binding enzyme [Streptomyces rapamycinicus]|uniref:AMP-binding enzyme n=1 Tax=Streptomyces rapamycinicus TaxID=1226757 RepID=UPI0020C99801|nr:hypothetical protein [Streptomyces rapamycinicus]UTP36742.1 hypothetical protein LIV37_50335 [Streptomyces rapamycinicus NRRL 5491]
MYGRAGLRRVRGAGQGRRCPGFFDTRDHGYLDEDGYLFIAGRADDTIIRGAENIAPAEIEDVLMRHPAVLDVAVVGVPDEEWGQRIEAVVVARPGATAEPGELCQFVRDALRGSKTPDRIEIWTSFRGRPRQAGAAQRRHPAALRRGGALNRQGAAAPDRDGRALPTG